MTQSFDEWWKEDGHPLMDCDKWSSKISYEAGQQSRQAEIDELQKRIDEALILCEKGCVLKAMSVLKGTNK